MKINELIIKGKSMKELKPFIVLFGDNEIANKIINNQYKTDIEKFNELSILHKNQLEKVINNFKYLEKKLNKIEIETEEYFYKWYNDETILVLRAVGKWSILINQQLNINEYDYTKPKIDSKTFKKLKSLNIKKINQEIDEDVYNFYTKKEIKKDTKFCKLKKSIVKVLEFID